MAPPKCMPMPSGYRHRDDLLRHLNRGARRRRPACHHARRHRRVGAAANQALQATDKGDRLDDWRYLPATLFAFMLIMVVSAVAAPYSFDALMLGPMNRHVA